MKNAWKSLAAACALVIGIYACMARTGVLEMLSPTAADTYYNLLVQGFRAGHLSLKKELPPGFAQLADPYDPTAHAPYLGPPDRMLDLSYYKGRLFLYFGVTPALILFWPFVALTGHYLFHREAVAVFCVIGFLAGAGLLRALWQRYFAEVSPWVVSAGLLALGLATGVPVLLSHSDVYEVAISCGYMLTMLALAAIWCALHQPRSRSPWLAVASVAYGLAVGARPSLLFGAVILLVPVAQAWRERRQPWTALMAATFPIMLIGLALMFYNARRFGSPFELGQHYELTERRQVTGQFFSLHFLWFNFRLYFLEPARWSGRFPFVHAIAVPPLPAGYAVVQIPFGVLTNIPLVWLALAVPLAWRNRSEQPALIFRRFVTAVALLFAICALTVGSFWAATFRYEVEFLPALLLLAVVAILGLERVLVDRPVWRRAVRCGWGLLLVFSVVFNLLASVEHYAYTHYARGNALSKAGRVQEALEQYELALQMKPDFAEVHYNLAGIFKRQGRLDEAIGQYEQALQINPDYVEAHNNLGVVLGQAGNLQEAIGHLQQAVRLKPDFAEAHNNLAVALELAGRLPEAIAHLEQAVRLKPDFAEAQNRLARLQALQ